MAGAIFNTVPPLAAGAGIKFDGERISTAAAPRNLLDNSDFRNPVNQRGQKTYTKGSWGGYVIDRWAVGSLTENIVSLVDGGITLKGGLIQWKDAAYSKLFVGKKLTVAIKESGVIHTASGVVKDSTIWDPVASTEITDGFVTLAITQEKKLELSVNCTTAKKIEWVVVYEGEYTNDTLPEYQPKGYGAELAECQRYYQRIGYDESIYQPFMYVVGRNQGDAHGIVSLPAIMRAIPSVTVRGAYQIVPSYAGITNLRADIGTRSNVSFIAECASITPSAAFTVTAKNDKSAYIEFSADL